MCNYLSDVRVMSGSNPCLPGRPSAAIGNRRLQKQVQFQYPHPLEIPLLPGSICFELIIFFKQMFFRSLTTSSVPHASCASAPSGTLMRSSPSTPGPAARRAPFAHAIHFARNFNAHPTPSRVPPAIINCIMNKKKLFSKITGMDF